MTEEMKAWTLDLQAKQAELKILTSKEPTDCTADEVTRAKTIIEDVKSLQSNLTEANNNLRAMSDARLLAADLDAYLKTPANLPNLGGAATQKTDGATVWATPRRARVKNFKDRDGIPAAERAYGFGRFLNAALYPGTTLGQRSLKWCEERGIPVQTLEGAKVQTEGSNAGGGFLVAPQFDTDLIDLREIYGVGRAEMKNVTMESDTWYVPRRAGGLTAYFVAETDAATESTKNWDQVALTAKELRALSYFTKNLSDDAFINVADDLAGEMSYAFAAKEDDCIFNGDGTSTYGGMLGLQNRFIKTVTDAGGTWTTDAHKLYNVGITNASGATWASIVLSDFNGVMSNLPLYARGPRTKWYCHQSFYDAVMLKLMLASGGVTEAGVANGAPMRFMGYPVVPVQKMPQNTTVIDTIPVFFGDLSLAGTFGDRRQTTIEMSGDFRFTQREIAVLASERFDTNWHDVGVASSSAGSRVAGPVVALAIKHS